MSEENGRCARSLPTFSLPVSESLHPASPSHHCCSVSAPRCLLTFHQDHAGFCPKVVSDPGQGRRSGVSEESEVSSRQTDPQVDTGCDSDRSERGQADQQSVSSGQAGGGRRHPG
ncbi:uncharacterized protein AB9X84_011892 [Acanthopagrus schlegelii]